MHPPAHLFALSRRAPSYFAWYRPSHRRAHAAAFPTDAEAGPSRPQRPMDDYRFPEKGRRGGPPDPYEVLGLERGAGAREIKSQYYKLALVLHPDSSHPSASAEHFATLSRAYKLLSVQQSRTSYLQTGYGWSGPADAEDPHASADAAMRSWARHARAHGAASWEAGARARGFRASEGGAGYYHTHPGEDFPFHDAPPKGNGDAIFMSNGAFVAFIAGLAGVGTFVQYYRMGAAVDDAKALLVDRHLHASKALAEARHEAALFGKERRDQIRRRVRENKVLSEIDKMERGEVSAASHLGAQHKQMEDVHLPQRTEPPNSGYAAA
ncbi:DnaJ-domain-containing protein [Cutaneotrichosporon oleaginosum]|uniref:DnaJ-domain-containing protein n=1 Tax=Cutaneotrichosporon oleaginosum TaxID=879819 RepID=A0A0J0XSR0_9TREE|nr:DnaJ-domain-containing protein [Cutaneotrichosporon oleaginosum]KLT44107.1 DnaJ-domain-containing protein [Cutaneotrichosporon oleaginosum]TXT09438.1 hypothetical protein COLE_03372 [Cutaneotrichosporon oleaginosum]